MAFALGSRLKLAGVRAIEVNVGTGVGVGLEAPPPPPPQPTRQRAIQGNSHDDDLPQVVMRRRASRIAVDLEFWAVASVFAAITSAHPLQSVLYCCTIQRDRQKTVDRCTRARLRDGTGSHFQGGTFCNRQAPSCGDNRDVSLDSRRFGSVSLLDVVGRVRQIWFSYADNAIRRGRMGKVVE